MEQRISIVNKGMHEYFGEIVTNSAKNQKYNFQPHTKEYLVNMLATGIDIMGKEQICAIAFLEAINQDTHEMFRRLKHLGDNMLFISGIFSDHFRAKNMPLEYYMSLGQMSYYNISHLIAANNVFYNLAMEFEPITNVLEEASDRANLSGDQSLVKLYEKWLIRESPRLEQLLKEKGFILKKSTKV